MLYIDVDGKPVALDALILGMQRQIADLEARVPDYHTVQSAAKVLKLPISTVQMLCRTHQLDCKKVGKGYEIYSLERRPKQAVAQLVETGRKKISKKFV